MDDRTASRLIPHFGQAPDIFEGITFIDRVAGMFYEYRELMSSLNVFFERESQSKDKGGRNETITFGVQEGAEAHYHLSTQDQNRVNPTHGNSHDNSEQGGRRKK